MAKEVGEGSEHSRMSIDSAQRRADIMSMRLDGKSFVDIAAHFNVSVTYIHKVYRKTMREVYIEDAEEMRKVHNARLEQTYREALELRAVFSPLVSAGRVVRDVVFDTEGNILLQDNGEPLIRAIRDIAPYVKSIELRLKIMERQAKLNGLDKPTKVALTDSDGENAAAVVFYLPDNNRGATKRLV